ncbi:MAG: cell division protein FtsW [Verrucomicrobiaceae bacterium]|nr:cell division protein FtsW [Verrucomicrobiaceae bacterium]
MARRSSFFLLLSVTLLVILGFTMLASTCYFMEKGGGEGYFNLRKQAFWFGVSVAAMLGLAWTDYNLWAKYWKYAFGGGLVVLVLCLIPGIGFEVNGSRRWMGASIGGIDLRVQPSEFAKILLLVALSAWYGMPDVDPRSTRKGFFIPAAMLAAFVLSIGMEEDLGNGSLTALLGISVMFVAGVRMRWLVLMGTSALSLLAAGIAYFPNRFERVWILSDLEKYKDGLGLQQWISLLAFGSGGIEGRHLGEGRMKLSYLPEAHTDFIFPMVGEELGLWGTAGTVLLFALIVAAGMCIAAYAPNRYGKLLGFGLTTLLGCEALLNMGVTTAMLPNKGLPLPFVSYGGSSLLAAFIAVGILVNIHRQGVHITRGQLPVIRRNSRWTPQI